MKRISRILLALIISVTMIVPQAAFAAGDGGYESASGKAAMNAGTAQAAAEQSVNDESASGSVETQDQAAAEAENANADSEPAEAAANDGGLKDAEGSNSGVTAAGNGGNVTAADGDVNGLNEAAAGDASDLNEAAENGSDLNAADGQLEVSDEMLDAEGKDAKAAKANVKLDDPYAMVSMLTLNEQDAIIMPDSMKKVELSTPQYGNGVLFKGKVGDLSSGRIELGADFNLNGKPVGRISLDGLSDKGVTVTANVYLDDAEDPVASFELGRQMGKKEWANDGDHTADVYDQKITGKHRVSIGFDISGKKADKKTAVLIRSFEFAESSIPVMYFNIDESQSSILAMNTSEDHSVECYGTVDLQVPDGFTGDYTDKKQKDLHDVELEYIRGRGNSTWGADKKPYKVKFDKKQDLFGMGANKHWVLLANRFDNSLVRNRMTYWLGQQLGLEYTPQCVPVEVVMNGTYYGSYLLCEQIRIGSSRVDIDDLEESEESAKRTDLPFISGGYLLSMSPYGDEDERNIFRTEQDVEMFIESPAFEEYDNTVQRDYIKGYIQATENAIFGSGFKDENGKSYTEYLDLDAAADYWWVQEFSANGDAYGSGSTYLYKKRDGASAGKLFWGPLWDFDYVAWGDLDYDNEAPTGLDNTSMAWFERMKGDKAFTDKLAERWKVLDKLLAEVTRKGGLLDEYYKETATSRKYDVEKWGAYGESYWGYDDDNTETVTRTYKEEIDQLRTWIEQRRAWVNENKSELTPELYTLTFKVDGKVIKEMSVRGGYPIEDMPEAPEKKGYFFRGWGNDEYGILGENDGVFENMVLEPQYVKNSEVVTAQDLYFGKYEVYVPFYMYDEEDLFYPQYTVMPEDADDSDVTWKSSDEEIAVVNEDGSVLCKQLGTVTITGTLASGKSSSYKLHVVDFDTETFIPDEISLNKTSVRLKEGSYTQIVATMSPQPTAGNISWISLDDSVASVDYNGVVTAGSPGKTEILAIELDSGTYAKCTVTVTADTGTLQMKTVLSAAKKTAVAKWDKIKGAKKYKVQYRKAGAKKWTKKTTKHTRYKVSKLKTGKLYEFRVAAVTKDGTGEWSDISRRYIKSVQARVRAGRKKATVTWTKDKKADGYQIRYSYKKSMAGAKSIRVKSGTTKYTIKGLKKGRKVYIQVRPLKKYKGKTYYGGLTSKKVVKIKK